MGGTNLGGYQVDRFVSGFYDARIGESVFGFSNQDEDASGGTIRIMARSSIGDLSDMLKIFPQMTYDEYMYERSYAQIQFMAMDNTHVKYLEGKDKQIWENYQKLLKAQEKFDAFMELGARKNNIKKENE